MKQQNPAQIFNKYYQEWLSNPDRMKNGYDYERTFIEIMQQIEKEVFQNSLGKVPENKNRKKKSKPVLGK
jgi:hypothetical protein